MRVIALINQKGGVGKTTSTANLGGALAHMGHKVLLIDIDPQANLSLHLDIDILRNPRKTIYDLLVGNARVDEVLVPTEQKNLSIIPSHIDLCSAELELVNTVGREIILRDALMQYTNDHGEPFDFILIDCPPSLGLLSLNALALAREVVIPIQAEFFALQGMGKLVEVVDIVQKRLNADLKITGIVACMYRSQTTLAKEVLKEVISFFGEIVYETKIRQNIKLAEAPGHGKTIFQYDETSNGALDYMALAKEMLEREKAKTEMEDQTPMPSPEELKTAAEDVSRDAMASETQAAMSEPEGISETQGMSESEAMPDAAKEEALINENSAMNPDAGELAAQPGSSLPGEPIADTNSTLEDKTGESNEDSLREGEYNQA